MLIDILTFVIIEIIKDVLKRHGISIATSIIGDEVSRLLLAGNSPDAVPETVIRGLGYGQYADQVDALASEQLLEIKCVVNAGELATVPNKNGEYSCPYCDLDIYVEDGVAEHTPILCYTCPESGENEYVAAEIDDTYICCGCDLGIIVVEELGFLKVYHQLRIE